MHDCIVQPDREQGRSRSLKFPLGGYLGFPLAPVAVNETVRDHHTLLKLVLAVAVVILTAQGRALGETVEYVDVHNHLFARLGSRSASVALDYEGAARVALAMMNKLGIRTMLVMPPPFAPDHPFSYDVDDFIQYLGGHSDRFAFLGGGGTLNVMIQEAVRSGGVSPDLRNRFRQTALELVAKGAVGFGELTAEHLSLGARHPHQTAPPDHPLFLLLADIAASHDVPIDIHMEAVREAMPLPARLASPPNPRLLEANIGAFERLLAHNRKARIIWSHVGWDNTGHRSAALTAELLGKHPNLYMSFKICTRDSLAESRPTDGNRRIKPEWLKVIQNFPDRFLIGSDQFYVSPRASRRFPPSAEDTIALISALPAELARKIGYANPRRIFKLDVNKR